MRLSTARDWAVLLTCAVVLAVIGVGAAIVGSQVMEARRNGQALHDVNNELERLLAEEGAILDRGATPADQRAIRAFDAAYQEYKSDQATSGLEAAVRFLPKIKGKSVADFGR